MVYGIGTKSFLASTEHRQNKQMQKQATETYLSKPREPELVTLLCRCRSWRYPHEPAAHAQLRGDWDWRRVTQ